MIVVAGQCLQNAPSEGGRVVGRMFSHVFGHGLRFRMFECVCAFVRARVCHGCGRNVRMLTRQLVSHSRFVAARPSARSASETSPCCRCFCSSCQLRHLPSSRMRKLMRASRSSFATAPRSWMTPSGACLGISPGRSITTCTTDSRLTSKLAWIHISNRRLSLNLRTVPLRPIAI
jgi:hypothetical protein